MSKRIGIIGGGIIGLTAAWQCRQRGHEVTVWDRAPQSTAKSDDESEPAEGCSYGNAGMIVPSHFVPLAAPGVIKMGLKWMANPESPFFIRPRCSWEQLSWLWKFSRACTVERVRIAAPLLRDMHLASRSAFEELVEQLPGDFGWTPRGLLMLCRTDSMLHEEAETAKLAVELGIPAQVLGADDVQRLDSAVTLDVRGGVYYPKDCHLSPQALMRSLTSELTDAGVPILRASEVTDVRHTGDRVTRVITNEGDFPVDELLVAAGIGSTSIGKKLRLRLPMLAGKGYSVTLTKPPEQPTICSILTEARVAITPMGTTLRCGGTMEITGENNQISPARIRGIVKSIPRYFPKFDADDFAACKPWVGLRPCSPDGLPYLGRTTAWQNVIVSTGHAMMGISLAMVSAKLVAEIVDEQPASIASLELLSPDRYR